MLWSAASEAVPIYPLYALLFADSGLSAAEISGLFVLWSAVGVVAEVPAGAWADRHSRRGALVLAGVLQAAGHVLWIAWPQIGGFALGFALWALGGAFGSGSLEALVHDGLAAAGEEHRYAAVMGRAAAVALGVQIPLAVAAGGLFAAGGYPLVGAASAAACLGAAALALTLPEASRSQEDEDGDPGFAATLRSGLREAVASRAVRGAVLAVAALSGLDAIEEYFALLAGDWGVPTAAVPVALVVIPLAGGAGAALAGRAMAAARPIGRRGRGRSAARGLGAVMPLGAAALALAALAAVPAGLGGVAAFYGALRLAMVVADARLQERIGPASRATVTSVASLGSELVAIALFGAWAIGGLPLTWVLVALVAVATARPLSAPGRGR